MTNCQLADSSRHINCNAQRQNFAKGIKKCIPMNICDVSELKDT